MQDAVLHERRELGTLLRAVVKIIAVSDPPDYEQPWQTCGSSTSSGSGVVVDTAAGLRVLTNAHCIQNHVFVEVRRYGKAKNYVAKVVAVGHECDLALLDVEDERFFHGVEPIPLGSLPELSDRVSVCGYPVGGERLSITEGIVSRIEVLRYAQRRRRLLAVQIDAAINDGNSGGPVLLGGELVGVAFQALEDAQQIGYMISVPVIEHFLADVDAGVTPGFPELGVHSVPLESAAHRRMLGLCGEHDNGVLVARVTFEGSAWGVLREGDVILEIDGLPITSDGTVPLRDGEWVTYEHAITCRHAGESVSIRVWRDHAELSCMVALRAPSHLVTEDTYDVRPSYFIFGGLLFVPLTRDYLKTWGEQWWQSAPHNLMSLYEGGIPTEERQEVVVMQKALADEVNRGYHDCESVVIVEACGVRWRSLAHLVEIVDAVRGEYVTFLASDGRPIVIDRQVAISRSRSILERFGVPRDRSADLPNLSVQAAP
ncbi:MAG: hypothetical protein A2289_17270 [Deltaproteobacteria bacterium RIFOXYA12_FULL_58_15]|nr:MAG: hypothetical protein A2289_17270 [Deltaproteobacteria bacterium RIFOXYA12_FULL_58_15]